MGVFTGGRRIRQLFSGAARRTRLFYDGLERFNNSGDGLNPIRDWNVDQWTGSVTAIDEDGNITFMLGNASAVVLTAAANPNNTGANRTVTVQYSVSPPATGFTGVAFLLAFRGVQPFRVTQGTYVYSNIMVENVGNPFIEAGSAVRTVSTAGSSIPFVTETFTTSQTSVQRTQIRRTVSCASTTCSGDARTVIPNPDVRTTLAPLVFTSQIPNPAYRPLVTAAIFEDDIEREVFITRAGLIRPALPFTFDSSQTADDPSVGFVSLTINSITPASPLVQGTANDLAVAFTVNDDVDGFQLIDSGTNLVLTIPEDYPNPLPIVDAVEVGIINQENGNRVALITTNTNTVVTVPGDFTLVINNPGPSATVLSPPGAPGQVYTVGSIGTSFIVTAGASTVSFRVRTDRGGGA